MKRDEITKICFLWFWKFQQCCFHLLMTSNRQLFGIWMAAFWQDICYFNFECLHPWGNILDYGNTFSNVGYIICGLFFLFTVNRRSQQYQRFCELGRQNSAYLRDDPCQQGLEEKVFYTVRNVLVDFSVCDWWRYCKALCDVKFRKIEGNGRTFRHIKLSNSVIS